MGLHFCQSCFIDQWSGGHAILSTIANLQSFCRCSQFFSKSIIDTSLHIDAVSTNAGLTIVAIFGNHRTLYRGIQIRIVEDDERRVATQFKAHFLDAVRTLAHQDLPHTSGTGESDLGNFRIGAELFACFSRFAIWHHIEDTSGYPSPFGQHGHGQSGKRCEFCRTCHKTAACCQGRCYLAGNHGIGEVPRCDGSHNTNWLLHDNDALVWLVTGDGIAINTFGFFREPFNEGRSIEDLAFGFSQWFAHLGAEDCCQIICCFHHQIEPFAQNASAFLAGLFRPFLLRGIGKINGFLHIGNRAVGDRGNHLTSRGIGHIEFVIQIAPFTADIGTGFKQAFIIQFHGSSLLCSQHGFFQDAHGFIKDLIFDGKRRKETHHIAIDTAGEQHQIAF